MDKINLEATSSSFNPDINNYSDLKDKITKLNSEMLRISEELQRAQDERSNSPISSIYHAAGAYKNSVFDKRMALFGLAVAAIPPILTAAYKSIALGEAPELSLDYFFNTGISGVYGGEKIISGLGGIAAILGAYNYRNNNKEFERLTGHPLTEDTAESAVALRNYVQEKLEIHRSSSR